MSSDPSTSPALEDLLERRLPSAMARHDAVLASAGLSNVDVAETKDAVAAIGRSISSSTSSTPASSVRERLLASKGRRGKYGIFVDRIARLFDLPLSEAEALMLKIEDPAAWNPFFVEGVEMIPVVGGAKCAGAIATLVRIQAGARFPDHTHRGDETMLVLDGGFNEPIENGEEAWRGDEIFRADGSAHALVGLPGVPCIAAVLIFGHGDFG